MKRKSAGGGPNHERWLVSYADFMTLLFAFFVVLYASSQVDHEKMVRLSAAIEGAFHDLGASPASRSDSQAKRRTGALPQPSVAVPPNVTTPLVDYAAILKLKRQLESMLSDDLKNRRIILRETPEGLIVSLTEKGFFDSGSAEIRQEMQGEFARVAQLIVNQTFDIRIEGHTDNVPIHNAQFESNWDLSVMRAANLAKQMIALHGCAPERLAVAGYGEYHPLASNDTAEGRRQNRRVDLVILAPHSKSPEPMPDPGLVTNPNSRRLQSDHPERAH